MSLLKNVRLAEGTQFQLRAEAFNAFNHVNFANIASTLGQTNYGQVTSTGPPRALQLAAKLTF